MKLINECSKDTPPTPALGNACLASCRKLLAQIEKTKDAILAEFRETREAHEHLLRLALNEAEALARQTEFPYLVFPTLAVEKAQAVSAWHARQRSVRRTNPDAPLAA